MRRGQRLRPSNRDGTPVDPVPFLVAALTGFATILSFGPVYLLELGVPIGPAVAVCAAIVVAVTALSYHRYVWTARTGAGGEVPAGTRLERLFYGVLVGIALLALLAIPLLVR